MMRFLALPLVLASICLPVPLIAAQPEPAPVATPDRVAAWQQDLDFLVEQLPKLHKNAFFKCPEEQWLARAAQARDKIPSLSDGAIVVELRRLVAMLGDGHTAVGVGRDASVQQRAYPIATIWLTDGIYAPVLPTEHEALIGQKLVRIGSTPIEEAIKRISGVRASDNESGMKQGVMRDLSDVDTLAALGIVADEAKAAFTFVDAKKQETTIELAPVAPGTDWSTIVTQRPDPASYPAWRALRRAWYGHEFLADSKTLYIWYDRCSDHPDKSVAAFTAETLEALDKLLAMEPRGVEHVVVDFRRNGGGNSLLFMPMIEALTKREFLKGRGRLFGLIGGRTFSSGMMNAYQLRNATGCLLLGEPTGGAPNGYGEVKTFTLPNSKLTVQYSTKLFRGVKEDTDAIYPELMVAPWSGAYFEGRDVVMERATTWPVISTP